MFIQEERQLDTIAYHKVLLGTGYFSFAVHFEGFIENYPFPFEGLQNILKGKWRAGPQNKGNSPSNLLLDRFLLNVLNFNRLCLKLNRQSICNQNFSPSAGSSSQPVNHPQLGNGDPCNTSQLLVTKCDSSTSVIGEILGHNNRLRS